MSFDADHALRIVPAPAGAAQAQGIVIEPLTHRRRDVVLVVTHTGRAPRINGQPAPSIAVLNENDQLLLDGAAEPLTLSCDTAPNVGPVPADSVGRACPFCRVVFAPGTRVYLCACGQALHLEDPAAGEDRLECATLAVECPSCGRPINLAAPTASADPEGASHVE